MAITDVFKRALAGELRLSRGHVAAIEPDGRVRVRLEPAGEVVCDVLRTGADATPPFPPGTEVLLASPDESGKTGVVLGAIGAAEARPEATESVPGALVPLTAAASSSGEPLRIAHREIVIEAGDELTLRCGEASIRITRDGRVVIRGEHILSRARGTNRIKGGSVAIN